MSGREVIEAAAERSRVTWRARVARLRRLAPTLLMGAIAAGAAWFIATKLAGEEGALFAPVATIITLGLTVGSRLNRAIELSLGLPLGIALADVLVLQLGSGIPQLIGIVFLATSIAVFLGGGPLLVTQAAVSAILVVTLQPPTDSLSLTHAADALIGCGVALLLNFVIAPIDPMALVRREAAVAAARHASAVLEQTTNLSVSVIVGQVRSTAADLLRTTGMEPEEARARIRGQRT